MKVFSTFIAWSNENKSCMRVDKREFTWEFSQLSLLDSQTRTRVAWELTSESLHESFLTFITWSNENKSCMRVDKQEFTWEFSITFIAWSNENKSCMRIDKREFTWEFSNFHCLIKREQELHESFLNSHVPVKQEQELHKSWYASWPDMSPRVAKNFSRVLF
jgi:hypothetical protein